MVGYKEKLAPHKLYMSVRQAFEKELKYSFSIKNATFSKMDTSSWTIFY